MRQKDLETTVKKIEEIVELLEVFGSKRKPLIKRKIYIRTINGETDVHILVGMDEVGKYRLNDVKDDVHFMDLETKRVDVCNEVDELFHINVYDKDDMYRTMVGSITHLKKINKFFKLSKPAKAQLEKLKYKNKSFVLIDGQVVDVTTPDTRTIEWTKDDVHTLPKKEDLMNQKVYIHGRDPVTNSMLMSRDFGITPFNLNALINEVISMNPHLVRDLHIDFYEERVDNSRLVVTIAIAMVTKYLSIHEELYTTIVANMPKSKDLLVERKRTKVGSDYVKAFINLKDNMYSTGHAPSEIKELIVDRRAQTSMLKASLKKVLVLGGATPTIFRYHEVAMFNNINHKLKIDAITFESGKNRNQLSKALQSKLLWIERLLTQLVEILKTRVNPFHIVGALNMYVVLVDVESETNPSLTKFVETILSSKDALEEVRSKVFFNPFKPNTKGITINTHKGNVLL